MSTTEHDKSQETGKHEFSEGTDRPEGSVAEGANTPLTDMTKTGAGKPAAEHGLMDRYHAHAAAARILSSATAA
jgi:hypothetical protein